MNKIIINAELANYGRLCSYIAKKALEGNEIIVLNSEKVLISGNKKDIIRKYSILKKKGGRSLKGPKISRIPFKFLKRGIRGMLPDHRRGIGKIAFSKIRCYNGIPEEFKMEKPIKIKIKEYNKYITLKELLDNL